MSKVAIITDTNSGIIKSDDIEGLYIVPMPFVVGDNTYYEGVDLTHDDFYKYLAEDVEVHTSQPSPDDITKLWKKVLEQYDEIVYIPMSSGLSGSCQTAMMLSEDFDGKVFVVDNQRISVPMKESVYDAIELAKQGKDGATIRDILLEDKFNSSIYIMLETLHYLKKGGRITKAAAAMGTLLHIKPVLQIQGEKLDAFSKVRTLAKGKEVMLKAIQSDIENRFGGEYKSDKIRFGVAHTANYENEELLGEELKKLYPGCTVTIDPLALSIACHTGPGALGVCCSKVLEY